MSNDLRWSPRSGFLDLAIPIEEPSWGIPRFTSGYSIGRRVLPSRFPTKTRYGEVALLNSLMRLEDWRELQQFSGTERNLGRHHWNRSDALRKGNVIVDLVAEVENFTVFRLQSIKPNLTETDLFSWTKRKNAWLKHGTVDLASLGSSWPRVQGFVEVRNALQHGLGELTDFQLSLAHRERVLAAVRSCSVHLDGGRVMLHPADVSRCADSCLTFISMLDCAAPE